MSYTWTTGETITAEKLNATDGLPSVTGSDNGKVLGVVSGAWAASNKVIIATMNNGTLNLTFRQIYEYINSGYLIYYEDQDQFEYMRVPLTELSGDEGDSLQAHFGSSVFYSQDLDEPMTVD